MRRRIVRIAAALAAVAVLGGLAVGTHAPSDTVSTAAARPVINKDWWI